MEKDLDMELYNKYLDGDKDAFELLYNKYKNKIQYFIFNIVKDYQKAEDITQEVFIYAMQNKVRDGYTFKYYIFLIAKSRAYNYINMENRRLEINEQYLSKEEEQIENDVANIIEESEKRKELIDAINMLDDKYKNAIYLVNIEELSYKETAEILGESVQNIKNLVHRGKVNLRKILLKKGFNEMNKVSKVLTIIICMIVILSGVTYAGVVIYNKYIKKQEEVNSRGLFDLGDGITTYETDLMANDMTWNENSRLYHKIIDNSEDYQIYKTRINELPNIEEINFDENFVVIIANENIRQMHEKDLTISDIVADDTTTHIIMKQKENPNYDNDNNIWYAIVDKSQLRDNADVEIEQHNISSEEFTKLEDLSYDYSKEEAIKDGCIVTENNKVISNNLELLDKFIEKTKNGETNFIRIYQKYNDEVQITDINFENGIYYVCTDVTRKKEQREDKYYYNSYTSLEKKEGNSFLIQYSFINKDNPSNGYPLLIIQ